ITYKILYNDAVAMTGGQPHDGMVTPVQIARQVAAEGASRVVVVTDEPEKYAPSPFASDVTVHHRDELDAVQRQIREVKGTTVIIYDQTCAAEKRRRRKRGTMVDPAKRIFINELVCEGCGDCGVQSNCVSVAPLETEFGRKRAIDQSTCNKDYSCVKGFCPSFVSVEGGRLKKPAKASLDDWPELPAPTLPGVHEPYGILVTGIGGTGVVTIGAILGMAAHLEGKGVSVLDMAGLAQKNGAVLSHIRIGATPDDLHAARIAAGDADLVLACDILVGVGYEAIAKMQQGRTRAVVNTALAMPADFTRNADLKFPLGSMEQEIRDAVGPGSADFIDATKLALGLMGDSIATNLFMVGYAYQKGLLPVSEAAITRAIELNGAAVESNTQSFRWGRLAAVDRDRVTASAAPQRDGPGTQRFSESLDETIARRIDFLTGYQDAAYAKRYSDLVALVRQTESARVPNSTALTEAVARYWFKLLAIKDEYEVARLYTDGQFRQRLAAQFEGDYTLKFHLAPPLWVKADPVTGQVAKREYGPWMMKAFGVLAGMKRFRGTALDIFGRSPERRMERQLIKDFATLMDELLSRLAPHNHALAVELAGIPEHIRGFGHVKERHLKAAKAKEAGLLEAFRSAKPTIAIVASKAAA
ncbi:MAG: indolepyruvate ferredoxin oxidoreductase family protein, partial [Betaproteobacteria bacterium]